MISPQRPRLVVLVPAVAGVAAAAILIGTCLVLSAVLGGASAQGAGCGPMSSDSASAGAPASLRPIFNGAARRYRLGARGPSILAGLTSVESGFGQNMGPSSAGAIGWTQFMPATWAHYGVDANGDGHRDPYDAADAIYSSARYLRASGAPRNWYRALFAYNHADWYVAEVLRRADELAADFPVAPGSCELAGGSITGVTRDAQAVGLAAVPGMPGVSVDGRILDDVLYLIRVYRITITAGYATSGHAADGEHPLALALDIVPSPAGSWDDVDRLARWAEPVQNAPRPPFRWVGYNGDYNHGRGNHLHLSWNHSPQPSRRPPVAWVDVMQLREKD